MAPVIYSNWRFNSLRDGYAEICNAVLTYGQEIRPRGETTRELIAPQITIDEPWDCLPTGLGRNPSVKIAAVEAAQLCGAYSDPNLVLAASSNFAIYQEPDGTFHGAYGRRVHNQASHVVEKLKADPESRQAVITLWNPTLDNLPGKRDYPCTVTLQFLIRDQALVCVTDMRSNDVWLGLAYDLFQFGQLQCTIANQLEVACGSLVHRPVSLHAYERDWKSIKRLKFRPEKSDVPLKLSGFRNLNRAWLITRTGNTSLEDLTRSEKWYTETLVDLHEKAREIGRT